MTTESIFRLCLVFILSLSASLLFMPIAILAGKRWDLTSKPRLFGKNNRSVPYLGGIAVSLAIAVGVTSITGLPGRTGPLLASAGLLLLLGLTDDRMKRLSRAPYLRILLQSVIVTGAWWAGMRSDTSGLFGGVGTALLLVAAMNAFNLLDNMDGVAGWTAAATSAGIAGVALLLGQHLVAALGASICGASLGFLKYNFPRAKIYLGNGGSLVVGFLIGALALQLRTPFGASFELLAVITLLAVPAADTSVAVLSRLLHGKSLIAGGVDHISHRLVRIGLAKRHAALAHGLICLLMSGTVATAVATARPQIMLVAPVAVALAALLLLRVRVYGAESRTPGPLRGFVLGVGVLVTAGLAMAVPPALAAKSDLDHARTELLRGRTALRTLDFSAARTRLASAQLRAEQAEKKLNSPLTWPASVLPIVRGNLQTARGIASGVTYLIPALQEGAGALQSLSAENNSGRPPFSNGQLNLDAVPPAREKLTIALSGARLGLSRVDDEKWFLLPPLERARSEFVREAGQTVSTFDKASGVADILPAMFGASGPRTYFLMIQNGSEQRATGGFLGAFGILRADRGKLTLERFDSNNALPEGPRVAPPSREFADRYARFDSNGIWQNVNMTPDFPTAAGVVSTMWESRTGQKVDGVIAVDAVGLAGLMKHTGPVSLPELAEPLTHENFVRVTLNEAYIRFRQKSERENLLVRAGQQVWGRLFASEFRNVGPLGESLANAFSGKHMQMWSLKEADALKRLGVDGSLKPRKDGDYLFVVGQNAGANKVDYYGHRRIDYRARVKANGDILSRASVSLDNRTPKTGLPRYITGPDFGLTYAPGSNHSYLSLYLGASTLAKDARINGNGTVPLESHLELGHGVISRYLDVPPGKSSNFQVDLEPAPQKRGEYRLLVQRQPGLRPDVFSLSVELPKGAAVKRMSPGMSESAGKVSWTGALDSDKEFVVLYTNSSMEGLKGLVRDLFS